MRIAWRSALVACLAAALSACASVSGSHGGSGQFEDLGADNVEQGAVNALALPDETARLTAGDLQIGPLDILDIRVFGVDELSGEYQVDNFGRLKFPLLDAFDARGLTAFELAEEIEDALRENMLQDPSVIVRMSDRAGETITIEGAVSDPGIFELDTDITLLQAVALAGGLDDSARSRRVLVFRTIEGERQVAGFDLIEIRRGEMADPRIFGNDLIVVEGSAVTRTYRELLRSIPLLGLFAAL